MAFLNHLILPSYNPYFFYMKAQWLIINYTQLQSKMRGFQSKTITFLWEKFHKLIILSNLCLYITTRSKGLSLETAQKQAVDRARWRSLVLPQAPDGSEEDWVTLLHSTKGLANGWHWPTHCVEAVVDDMLDVFAHPDLSHQLVLVAVHPSQLTHMGKDVLHTISQLCVVSTRMTDKCYQWVSYISQKCIDLYQDPTHAFSYF